MRWLRSPAASAKVRVSFERLKGFDAPGTPAKYDKVGALKVGPKNARNVLILNPGTSASASYFVPLAKDVVTRAKGWQVWAVERRENLLEDHSMFNKAKAGTATPQQVFDYYLGHLTDPSISPAFQSIPTEDVAFARNWGMRVEVEDIRRVVKEAKKLGGRVAMGGHSLGGSITTAYATWDFHGKSGASDLWGLVYIDGGSSPAPVTPDAARASLQTLSTSTPWLTFGGIPAPLAGLFNTSGALSVLTAPDDTSIGWAWPALPANLKPPVEPTNEGQYGYALDVETSPAGADRGAGAPRTAGRQRHTAALDPGRRADPDQALRADVLGLGPEEPGRHRLVPPAAADDRLRRRRGGQQEPGAERARRARDARQGPAQAAAHLRVRRGPGRPAGARRGDDPGAAVRHPKKRLVLLDRHTTYSHNDPNSASPKNDFVAKLIPFLKKVGGR